MISKLISKIYPIVLSEKRKKQFEKLIFFTAIITFTLHFTLIILARMNIVPGFNNSSSSELNPISAIYTPFSIILLYEIYLLIYYLPMSITIYLGKQYEIIALIFIRKIFDDLSKISTRTESLDLIHVQGLLITFIGLLILCLLIFLFYKLSGSKPERIDEKKCEDIQSRKFVLIKKIMALGLMILFIFLFIISLFDLKDIKSIANIDNVVSVISNMNNTFFDTFFTALIITEVLLLLFTFSLSEKFSKVIRNSGFIISTILLKLSFRAEGLANISIILVAVGFGVSILAIHKLFYKKL